MALSASQSDWKLLSNQDMDRLMHSLSTHQHSKLIQRALAVLINIAEEDAERLDWKILASSLEDLERGFTTFASYRHVRKIAIFGSARTPKSAPEYQIAADFARCVTQSGFMVITGAGGGIMQAGNEGAGREKSFGLNIKLPFEPGANELMHGDEKLIDFKYFFTRKLFFLRETDAIALFPGGFGTQDEAFETLTLCQTGKHGPVPLVLIDKPGGDYWHAWNEYICKQLMSKGLISPEDSSLYTITDNLEEACNTIKNFYSVYHSSRYVGQKFVMRLNSELTDEIVEQLNLEFKDFLKSEPMSKSSALPEEQKDETENLPRLVFSFNPRHQGRLYQLIARINQLGVAGDATQHPERK